MFKTQSVIHSSIRGYNYDRFFYTSRLALPLNSQVSTKTSRKRLQLKLEEWIIIPTSKTFSGLKTECEIYNPNTEERRFLKTVKFLRVSSLQVVLPS